MMELPMGWLCVCVDWRSARAGGASQRRDVAGSKLDPLSQAPSPGPSPSPSPSPQPQPKGENGARHELLMQRKVKTVFSNHVMCVLF